MHLYKYIYLYIPSPQQVRKLTKLGDATDICLSSYLAIYIVCVYMCYLYLYIYTYTEVKHTFIFLHVWQVRKLTKLGDATDNPQGMLLGIIYVYIYIHTYIQIYR